jgi:hypothetical protein
MKSVAPSSQSAHVQARVVYADWSIAALALK